MIDESHSKKRASQEISSLGADSSPRKSKREKKEKKERKEKKEKKSKKDKKDKKTHKSSKSKSGSNSSSASSDDDDDNLPRSIITGKKIKMNREVSVADQMLEIERAAKRHYMNSQF